MLSNKTKKEIIDIFEKNKRSWRYSKKEIKLLLGVEPDKQEIYDIVYNISESEKVAECGKEKSFRHFSFGYEFCKRNCPCSVTSGRSKAKDTMVERYGCEHASQNTEIQNRIKATNRERYGCDYPMSNEGIRKKSTETNIKNRGVAYPTQCPVVKQKIVTTNQERYGSDYAVSSDEIRKKIEKTNESRYGGKSPLCSNEVRDKVGNTMINKYGHRNPSHVTEIRDRANNTFVSILQNQELRDAILAKRKNTTIEKYGVENYSQINIPSTSLDILSSSSHLSDFIKDKSCSSAAEILGISYSCLTKTMDKLGLYTSQSSYENEIASFLDDFGITYQRNVRKPLGGKYELDFFFPDHNLAIEFNGIYWHSTARIKDTLYHYKKMKFCKDANIKLLMINEDEWLLRPTAWKNRITNILKRSTNGPPARKLKISAIGQQAANSFFSMYHIQGETSGIINAMAAFNDNGDIVAVMAFNKQRNTGKIELIRYCTSGSSHAGVFSRLFSHSVKTFGYNAVISFADLKHSSGEVYQKNGFSEVYHIRPDYRYVIRNRTYHKSSFTKAKIKKKYGVEAKTERTAMESLGFHRIYDCGKIKYIWEMKHQGI